MPYFSFKENLESGTDDADAVRLIDNTPLPLSRTGYTGKFGFEIFVAKDDLLNTWRMLLCAGASDGLIVCGLAARDSLRVGAVLPLSHQDIGTWKFANNPWLFALPYNETKTEFTESVIGAQALMKEKYIECTYAFVGDDLCKVSAQVPPAQVPQTTRISALSYHASAIWASAELVKIFTALPAPTNPKASNLKDYVVTSSK